RRTPRGLRRHLTEALADRSLPLLPSSNPCVIRTYVRTLAAVVFGGSSFGVGAAHLEQLQAQVADLGEQAVQGRLVGDRPGDGGPAPIVGDDLQAVEPGRPAAVQDALDVDLVVHPRLRRGSPPRATRTLRKQPGRHITRSWTSGREILARSTERDVLRGRHRPLT